MRCGDILQSISKRRSRLEVVRDILKASSESHGVTKTEIVYGAKLNFNRANKYLRVLISKGLIDKRVGSTDTYHLTKKGMGFLDKAEEIFSMLSYTT